MISTRNWFAASAMVCVAVAVSVQASPVGVEYETGFVWTNSAGATESTVGRVVWDDNTDSIGEISVMEMLTREDDGSEWLEIWYQWEPSSPTSNIFFEAQTVDFILHDLYWPNMPGVTPIISDIMYLWTYPEFSFDAFYIDPPPDEYTRLPDDAALVDENNHVWINATFDSQSLLLLAFNEQDGEEFFVPPTDFHIKFKVRHVPVPAAAWIGMSTLGVLGIARRFKARH